MLPAKASDFKPTPDQIRAAETLLAGMAYEATVKPIVLQYQTSILQELTMMVSPKYLELGETQQVITNPDLVYLATDENQKSFYDRCDVEKVKAGFEPSEAGVCPACAASWYVTQAEWALLDCLEPVTGISRDQVWESENAMSHYTALVGICLGIMTPYVSSRANIVNRILA